LHAIEGAIASERNRDVLRTDWSTSADRIQPPGSYAAEYRQL